MALPKSRRTYWVPKLRSNKDRDLRNRARLRKMGWKSLVLWDCQTAPLEELQARLLQFFKN